MTLLANHLLERLQLNAILDRRDYVGALYGDVRGRYVFHSVGPKRWDVLCHLLEFLAAALPGDESAAYPRMQMAEIGVDTANVSLRLLKRYPTLLARHVGVDPYRNPTRIPGSTAGDEAYVETSERLAAYGPRSLLLRQTSEEAVVTFADGEFDLVFLDARHDHDAVL